MLYNKEWEKPAVKLEPWQQHLLDAAALIRKGGWWQVHPVAGEGNCVMTALHATAEQNQMPDHWDTALHFGRFLGLDIGAKGNSGLGTDATGRTKEEVIAVLEAAATKGE